MDRLIAPNTVPFSGRSVAPSTGTPQYATDGNPSTQTPATVYPAYIFNMVQDEIMAVLAAASIAPDATNWAQLLAAINHLIAVAVATRVQQGTGIGQLSDLVKIGWSSAGKLKVTVDTTDLGPMALGSDLLGGTSQSYQNVVSVRAPYTTYTNSTGRPIFVNIEGSSSAANDQIILVVGGVTIAGNGQNNAGAGMAVSAIVPDGATYYAGTALTNTLTLGGWTELR